MATAKKLPSGAWRTQASKTINGKKVVKSFTVHPDQYNGNSKKAKAQSELIAREWQLSSVSSKGGEKTIGEAIEDYISDRSKVLSPSTITGYKRIKKQLLVIADLYISDIDTPQIQRLINDWSISITAKTIKNRIGFLMSVLDYSGCDKKFKLRYPMSSSKQIVSPDREDVAILIDSAPEEFRPILYLAAFGGLRRGEIAALKQKDISRDMLMISVHADLVEDDGKYFYKPYPKNGMSGTVQLPKFVIDSLPFSEDPEEYVFNLMPNIISKRYDKLKKKTGLPFNFHSLRHYAASFRSDLSIPSKYIEEVGRWKNSKVMKQIYDNTLNSSRKKYTKMANDYIEEYFNKKKQG